MSCKMITKIVSGKKITFTYSCSTLESLLFEGSLLAESLEHYCKETNKELDFTSYVTENKDEFILRVSVEKR